MKYGFNIEVNYTEKLINIYEWEDNDDILLLKKVPIIKVSSDLYNNIINKNIKIDLNYIKNISRENNIIFTSEYDAVCVCFLDNGKINKISKLSLEDEVEVLEQMYKAKETKINYEIIDKNNNPYTLLTRTEETINKSIKKELEKIKNNEELIEYLCFELLGTVPTKNKFDKLYKELSEGENKYQTKFYEIMKLLNNA